MRNREEIVVSQGRQKRFERWVGKLSQTWLIKKENKKDKYDLQEMLKGKKGNEAVQHQQRTTKDRNIKELTQTALKNGEKNGNLPYTKGIAMV